MTKHPTVKIFCVDHRKDGAINPAGLTTFRVGPGCDTDDTNVLKDNIGDNVSELNPCINEATALYWVWKHPECREGVHYIGFCHYRRFLLFRTMKDKQKTFSARLGLVPLKPRLISSLPRFNCSQKDAEEILSRKPSDGILPLSTWVKEHQLRKMMTDNRFASNAWLKRACELMRIHDEEFAAFFERELSNGSRFYPFNTFCVKTEHFSSMCETVLPVTLSLAEEWRNEPSEKITPREPGFITEYMIGTYWKFLKERKLADFEHCQCLCFLSNGHGIWYKWFSKVAYKFFPDIICQALASIHKWLVIQGFMPHP